MKERRKKINQYQMGNKANVEEKMQYIERGSNAERTKAAKNTEGKK
jgi:hypothetical protein